MCDELFLAFLAQHDDAAWLRTIDRLGGAIHPVDRAATRIWFHFFPLALERALAASEDPDALARRLLLQGHWRLGDQVDTSHAFLYGHRYWPAVKPAVLAFAGRGTAPGSLDLGALIHELAREVARETGVAENLLVGMAAIGLRTLEQAGPGVFAATAAEVRVPEAWARLSPDAVVRARARDDSQGLFGFLRGDRKRWSVVFDERDPAARFALTNSQQITSGAALDTRDHRARDPRCSEGPIPVHCRSCSCGTCWVGVLGGAEKLSAVEPRERDKLRTCGYGESDESHPVIRLACQAQAYGAVTIVIPPWNGQLWRLARETAPDGTAKRS
ncbi:MAG: hypothetical protein AB7H88_20910 [Vicinamibacterales bacterium]